MMTDPVLDPQPAAVETSARELRFKLPVFEGPLDLLLYLIKKDEIDIYDIPLEHITQQYLEYLRMMQMLDLEIAGEYLVVAATLLYIKSRELLPKDQQPPEDEAEEGDPRWELIRQLVEYKKFKEAALHLQTRLEQQEKVFRPAERTLVSALPPEPLPAGDVGIFDLIAAFQKVLSRANAEEDLREIFDERFTVADKMQSLQEMLGARERMLFSDLFPAQAGRTEIVVTFLALLELIRQKLVRIHQPEAFAEIEIGRGEAAVWN
jgi:segregation and condensation protein A